MSPERVTRPTFSPTSHDQPAQEPRALCRSARGGLQFAALPGVATWQRLVCGTVSPNQFYVGSHFDAPLGSPEFLLRPGIEGETGGGVTLASINFEFVYCYELPSTDWAIYQGIGPAVNFLRVDDTTTVRGGFNFVFGVRHNSGFFSELKIGSSGSPNLRYGVGFTVKTDRTDP